MLANSPKARQLRYIEKLLDLVTGRIGLVRPTRLTQVTGRVGLVRTTRPTQER